MDLTKGLHDRDFFQQMDYFEVWSKDRVEHILTMKNMCITLTTDLGGKAPHQKFADNQEKLLADAAKKAFLLKSNIPLWLKLIKFQSLLQILQSLRINPNFQCQHQLSK